MATTRFQLRPKTARKLNKFANQKDLEGYSYGDDAKLHCRIPVCIGYGKDSLSADILYDLALELTNNGYEFTIYAAPRCKFDNEKEDPFDIWRQENQRLIKQFGNKVIHEAEWRNSTEWKEIYDQFNKFLSEHKEVTDPILAKEVSVFRQRAERSDFLKKILNEGEVAIKNHTISCTVDCLLWMMKMPSGQLTSLGKEKNVLINDHVPTSLMSYVFENAKVMGYLPRSLKYLMLKTEKISLVRQVESNVDNALAGSTSSPVQTYAATMSAGLHGTKGEAIKQLIELAKTDITYLKLLATLLLEIEKLEKFEKTDLSASPQTAPTNNIVPIVNGGSPSRLGVFATGSRSSSSFALPAQSVVNGFIPGNTFYK